MHLWDSESGAIPLPHLTCTSQSITKQSINQRRLKGGVYNLTLATDFLSNPYIA